MNIVDDNHHTKRPSLILKKRSAPLLGTSDNKSPLSPIPIQKKSHRVTALIETLHNDNSKDNISDTNLIESKNTPEEEIYSTFPESSPQFLRGISVDTGKTLLAKNLTSSQDLVLQSDNLNIWKDGSIDLNKDTFREFIEEVINLLLFLFWK